MKFLGKKLYQCTGALRQGSTTKLPSTLTVMQIVFLQYTMRLSFSVEFLSEFEFTTHN
jgi:hypothetical protein